MNVAYICPFGRYWSALPLILRLCDVRGHDFKGKHLKGNV